MREDQPRLRRCEACSHYTLNSECPKCGKRAVSPAPPKYSPEDKYAKYRRAYKEQEKKQ